jgi:hypothetical protein
MKQNFKTQITIYFLVLSASFFLLMQCSKTAAKNTVEQEPTKLITHAEGKDTIRQEGLEEIRPIKISWLNAATLKKTLDTSDLGAIIGNQDMADFGFYGEDHYRIEFYFSEVKKDPSDPSVYLITGKNRFKKNITNFTGKFFIDSLAHVNDPNLDANDVSEMGVNKIFSAAGRFEIQEDTTAKGSGAFVGRFKMDYSSNSADGPQLWYFSDTPNRGSGIRYDGIWKSHKTGKTKSVIWAKDIFRFANDILKDFSVGEREVEINPIYRNLGWDDYWENMEWWSDTKS